MDNMELIDDIEIVDAQGLENIVIILKKNLLLCLIIGFISFIIYKKKYNINYNINYYKKHDEIYKSRRSVTPINIDEYDDEDSLID